jgi:hypothetical protein
MIGAVFNVLESTDSYVLIRDVGPWDRYPTVTNDAEAVVKRLLRPTPRRIFYFDSDGDLGEVVVKDGQFAGFAPCSSVRKSMEGAA